MRHPLRRRRPRTPFVTRQEGGIGASSRLAMIDRSDDDLRGRGPHEVHLSDAGLDDEHELGMGRAAAHR